MKTKSQLLVDVYNGKISIDELKHSKDYAEIYFSNTSAFDTADIKRRQDGHVPVFQACFFITGNQAGIGKSCFGEVMAENFSRNGIHISSDPAVPFDHYLDQDAIVWHDFRAGDIKEIGGLPKFLNLINPQKLNTYTNVKHSSVKLKNKFWFFDSIMSVKRIIEFSCSIKDNDNWTLQEEPASQMFRRIIPIELEYVEGYDLLYIRLLKANQNADDFETQTEFCFKFHFDRTKKVDSPVFKFYNSLSAWLFKFWKPSTQDFDYIKLNQQKPKPKSTFEIAGTNIDIYDIGDFEL